MAGKINREDRERLKEAVQESQTARAAEARAEAQDLRAPTGSAPAPPLLLSIPEAARRLQVAERALRHVLTEPDLEPRLVERTRKVGIYYKSIPLLPPDLMADVPARLADRKAPERRPHGGKDARGE